jgi:hypothetical protein
MSYGANNPNGVPIGLPSIVSLGLAPLVNPYPALNLDFTNPGSLDSRITFTRASSATFFDQLGVLQTAASGAARFTYDPATLQPQGLLIEEQRTNLCLDSQNLAAGDRGSSTGWYAITRASITSNAVVAPDGTLTGNKIVANTDNNTHFAASRTTAGSTTNTNPITFSGYLKAGELTTGSFLITEGTTYSRNSVVYFNLSAGTATTPSTANGAASASATITPVGNGWYRCTLTVTLGGTDTRVEVRVYPTNSTTTQTFVGNNFDGIYAWGFQIEAGAFPTSYIPTTTTALTRNADVATMTGTNFSSWYNASEGTVYSEFSSFRPADSANAFAYDINQDGNNYIAVRTAAGYTPDRIFPVVLVSGTAQFTGETTVNTGYLSMPIGVVKNTLAYKVNDFASSWNAVSPLTDTSGTLPVPTQMFIGVNGANNAFLNGTIRSIRYYPTRVTNAQLQALTG